MTTDRRHRSPSFQPELPLPSPPAAPDRADQVDWRLDERTRRIGRQGVAAARALLGETPSSLADSPRSLADSPGGGHDGDADGARRRAGRAA